MRRTGGIITLPAGTLVRYWSLLGSEGRRPVRLMGSKYIRRTYWVQNDCLN